MASEQISTFEASPNIAFVKYWGKRDENLMLPQNGSISATMDSSLRTRTTVMFSKDFKTDEAWLDGKKVPASEMSGISNVLNAAREKSNSIVKAKVVSINCFPTGAGLASSASGMAALACACNSALNLKFAGRELSIIARMGSGSASRSVYGGFSEWKKGEMSDGSDSVSVQIEKKKISSREGMKRTVETSQLFRQRLAILPKRIETVRRAIVEKDYSALFEEMMRESNNMHAVMLDSYPPICYLTDASLRIIQRVHELNGSSGSSVAGYTFDAGPNAHVFTLEKNAEKVKKAISAIPGVHKIIVAKVGMGPLELSKKDALIDSKTGNPKKARFDEQTGKIIIGK